MQVQTFQRKFEMNNKQTLLHLSRVILVSIMTTLVVFAVVYGLQYLRVMLMHASVSWNG
jgi:hypothetical protein